MSPGLKLTFFLVFVVVWAILAFLLLHISTGFEEGGWGMYPILAVGMVAVMIIVERLRFLYLKAPIDRRSFQAEVERHLLEGNVSAALSYCQSLDKALPRIVAAGLAHLHRPDQEVQEAVDEAALRELPHIEVRTGYLAMIGNISTLLGLLGTIVGLIKSFAGVSIQNVNDPASIAKAKQYLHLVPQCVNLTGSASVRCIEQNKATILAKGISEAMNCTAFGLGVGIAALLGFSVLNGRTQSMIDEINDTSVNIMNLAVGNRRALKLG